MIHSEKARFTSGIITADLTADTQKSEQVNLTAIERLVEAGLVEAYGTGRGRTYTLSAKVYRHAGQKAAYVRQAGFDPIQQEQMVLAYIDRHGSIKRAETMDLCRITGPQASHLLNRLRKEGKITQQGERVMPSIHAINKSIHVCIECHYPVYRMICCA